MEADGRADHAEGRDGNAQLCGGTDATREAVFSGRCGAYRAAYGREGVESCGRGCSRARAGAGRILQVGEPAPSRRVFGDLFAARVESAEILVVDDGDAAFVRY